MEKVIVVDIDGTVVDNSKRLAYVLSKALMGSPEFWKMFLGGELFHMDKPLPRARACLQELAKTHRIVYLSGRRAGTVEATRKQLEDGGFPAGEMFLRPGGKTIDFKRNKVMELKQHYDIVCAIGDNPEDIMAYREAGVENVRLVLTNMDWLDCPCEGEQHA